MRTLLSIALLFMLLPGLYGCHVSERRLVLPGHDADQVWNAMVAATQEPDYMSSRDVTDRWVVRENHAAVDADAGRIEVFRVLERELHMPRSPVRRETREWKFLITLESREPPTILFQARNAAVPAHVWEEADRYFIEVQTFLAPAAPAAPSESVTTEPMTTAPGG